MPQSSRVLVTGGAGFIGSNIVRTLLQRGYNVKVIDNLSTGFRKNLNGVESHIEFVLGDIRDLNATQRACRGVDYVLHQAAVPSVPRSINDPITTHESNVDGTFNVLLASRDNNVRKVVLASSSSIYGNRKTYGSKALKRKKESMKPMPLSPYAVQKLASEEYGKIFAHIYHIPTVCLRYFNVFGPLQNPKSEYAAAIPRFITAIMRNERPRIFGDGRQSRDFTYVENVVDANILAMNSTRVKMGETLNIACGKSISLLRLIDEINRILGKHIKPEHAPQRPGEVRHSLANVEKAKKLIGYEPKVDFAEGLRKTVGWYKEKA